MDKIFEQWFSAMDGNDVHPMQTDSIWNICGNNPVSEQIVKKCFEPFEGGPLASDRLCRFLNVAGKGREFKIKPRNEGALRSYARDAVEKMSGALSESHEFYASKLKSQSVKVTSDPLDFSEIERKDGGGFHEGLTTAIDDFLSSKIEDQRLWHPKCSISAFQPWGAHVAPYIFSPLVGEEDLFTEQFYFLEQQCLVFFTEREIYLGMFDFLGV